MQQENPIKNKTKLIRLEFCTNYENLNILNLLLEEIEEASSYYKDQINNEESDLWIYNTYISNESSQEQVLKLIKDFSIGEIKIYNEEPKDWIEYVKVNSKPVIAGKFIVLNNNYHAQNEKKLIELHIKSPMAFGTGHHQTTKGCLQIISKISKDPRKVLDIGTGTGILAMAAKKMWQQALVDATEIEEASINVAKTNISANDLNNISIKEKYNFDQKYDLILANILLNTLIEISDDINKIISKNGKIILSGITKSQLEKLENIYHKINFKTLEWVEIDNWITLLMEKQ